jgi:predicted nucleic acid-binding protein
MTELCFDACSLIYLTKIRVKELLPKLGGVNVCGTVKQELLEDEHKYPDAAILKSNMEKHIINVQAKAQPIVSRQSASLGAGEHETIAYCLKSGASFVCDDRQAVNYALGLGLKPKTSEIILLDLLDQDVLSETEFKERFDDLSSIKQLKTPIITYFRNKAGEIVAKKKATKRTTRLDNDRTVEHPRR